MDIPLEKVAHWFADPKIVPIRLTLGRPIAPEYQTWLSTLIKSWYEVGYYGAFGGHLLDIGIVEYTDQSVEWTVDFHGTPDPDRALETLHTCLSQFALMHGVGIERITIGWT